MLLYVLMNVFVLMEQKRSFQLKELVERDSSVRCFCVAFPVLFMRRGKLKFMDSLSKNLIGRGRYSTTVLFVVCYLEQEK